MRAEKERREKMTQVGVIDSDKGVPARESRTEIRLVSPAAGCQKKKKDTSS